MFIICVWEILCDVYIIINVIYVMDKLPAELKGLSIFMGSVSNLELVAPNVSCWLCFGTHPLHCYTVVLQNI